MDKEEKINFQSKSMALSKMGHIGIALLVISGDVLITPYWRILPSSSVLISKLVLVLVLATLIGIITSIGKRVQQGNTESQLIKMEPLGKILLLTAFTLVVLAVYFFH